MSDCTVIYKGDSRDVSFIFSRFPRQKISKRNPYAHYTILLLLKGEAMLRLDDGGEYHCMENEMYFISSGFSWTFTAIELCETLEVYFEYPSSGYSVPMLKYLRSACETTYCFAPLRIVSALHEGVAQTIDWLSEPDIHLCPLSCHDMFLTLGVYYRRTELTNFLYPMLQNHST